ncbi:cingulin-like protein 1 isoform X1 [Cydia splendana]|uniref:cingulin-like protein 1 isoform X1 n=1 Tax=Cydia splendana TaxID=1100963 RepID=UPI0028F491F7
MLIVVMMTMMFNGLVCVDSDNSDFTKDSGGGGSSCAGAGASERYYRDKLIATLQILENKEETIRVQGSSLCVAEGRIAELTKRATQLRRELDHKAQELTQLRQCAESCRVDKSDVCISTDIKEVEGQRQLVQTLEDNLAVVTDLYRECFYEAAKQEELIDMLRKSYLDVRLMERAKTDRITKLHNIINTQKRSIEQCQDVVMEVESLKSEISSFLNSSNNDSGMWERGSESPDVGEELADILEQLRQLQHMLTSDCTCGLQEENSSLKERNRTLEDELEQVRQRNKDLDECLRYELSEQYEKQLKEKERETEEAVEKLAEVEKTSIKRGEACETLKRQLQQAQVLVEDKTAELVDVQETSAAKDVTIRCLQQKLEHSETLVQEGLNKLSEVTQSRSDILLKSQATISELEHRLKLAVRRCRELEAGCREQERSTSKLQACLEEAQARGALLCDESRRVTAGVRQWMREKKQQTREQQDKIKLQKLKIRELERCARMRQNNDLTSQSETEPSCSVSPCESGTYRRRLRHMCASEIISPSVSLACVGREDETASCSKCVSNRQQESESEMASCSRAPVPPTRKKRQQSRNDLNCLTPRLSRVRFEPCSHPDIRWTRLYSRLPRQLSSGHVEYSQPRQVSTGPVDYRRPRQVTTDEVLERVEHLHTALVDGQRRWGRHRR